MRYSRDNLLLVNSNTELGQSIKDRINDLGLCYKTSKGVKRGRRSGARVNKRDFVFNKTGYNNKTTVHSIPVISKYRPENINNLRLNSNRYLRHISTKNSEKKNATFCLLNCRSINKKELQIRDYILDNDIDCICLTETWLQNELSDFSKGQITPQGYSFLHKPRVSGKGGGVALISKENTKPKQFFLQDKLTFECIHAQVTLQNASWQIFVVYRPPPNAVNKLTFTTFKEEFSDFISEINSKYKHYVILGDFNIHIDNRISAQARDFSDILDTFDLAQYVPISTHRAGHTLDLVISHNSGIIPRFLRCDDLNISDHKCVIFDLPQRKPPPVRRSITYRDLRQVDLDDLKKDISDHDFLPYDDPRIFSEYHQVLTDICDKHAPSTTKSFILRPNTQWYNQNIRSAKVVRRRLERKMMKSGLESDKMAYKKQCDFVNFLLNEAKQEFYSNKILDSKDDKRKFFSLTKRIMNWSQEPQLPSGLRDVPTDFCDFFVHKIVKIHQDLTHKQSQLDSLEQLRSDTANLAQISSLDTFNTATEEEIHRIILTSSNATCDSDPIPTHIVKHCIDVLLTPITNIVNNSLENGVFPQDYKKAIVIPLLKKSGLDPDILKNYRPISNLAFISKVIEKVVLARVNQHLAKNELNQRYQSAYRKFHSTETALLKVHSDLASSLDNKKMSVLILLDLSAAFDTIDHGLLLSRLADRFCINGTALAWFKSYLSDRVQVVKASGCFSPEASINFGVPQGSILGPLLFSLYTAPVSDIASRNGLCVHLYADDTQLYVTLDNTNRYVATIENCICEIKDWMTANFLRLNSDKTEVLLIGTPYQLKKLSNIELRMDDSIIFSSDYVRNLGAYFDKSLSMDRFVREKSKAACYNIRCISQIRRFLTTEATEALVNAYVTSRLDYCSSLLYGVNRSLVLKLQRIQNMAARVISRTSKYDHITPVLKELHWLPVEQRIAFRILVHTFKCLYGKAPIYICDMVSFLDSTRARRSSSHYMLKSQLCKTKYGPRAFKNNSALLWNKLPLEIRSCSSLSVFKRYLKTFLFKQAYNC